MRIESILLRNYRVFRKAELKDLPSMATVVGANGSGKSTLFDALSFLKDALNQNVAHAVARRGGLRELVSRGESGPISIIVHFRGSREIPEAYRVDVAQENDRPVVRRELLAVYGRNSGEGPSSHLVDVSRGKGKAIAKGAFTETERPIELLRFQDGSFKDPFIARYVSDGTIKMFAYLILLHDPKPHPLLAVEEPENQLYPALLRELAEEFRDYGRRGGQVFVSTHSPEFLNGVKLDEIYWFVKKDGFATVRRASDSKLLRDLYEEGDPPGALWKQRLFEGVDPE